MLLYVMSSKNHLSKHWVDERLGDICFRDEVDLGGYVFFLSFYHFIFSFLFNIYTQKLFQHLGSLCLQNGTCGVGQVGSQDPSQVFLNLG